MQSNTNWEQAINSRRSVRSYQPTPLDTAVHGQLQEFIDNMELPFPNVVKTKFFTANSNKKLYSFFNAPPDNLAFIANTDVISISKTGFTGELIILFATSLGLSTCWFGHYNLEELEARMPHLGNHKNDKNPIWGYGADEVKGERVICITPVAYWKEKGASVLDKLTKAIISFKRKPVQDIIEGDTKVEQLPETILYALDLARKAASATNSQPWRFKISSDYKHIRLAMPVGYRHIKWEHPNVDIGICAAHFWLGLKLRKQACSISITKDRGCAVWEFSLE